MKIAGTGDAKRQVVEGNGTRTPPARGAESVRARRTSAGRAPAPGAAAG